MQSRVRRHHRQTQIATYRSAPSRLWQSAQEYLQALDVRIGVVLTLLCVAASAPAAVITVNSTADNTTASDGLCTLREAINNVNTAHDTTAGDCAAGTGTGDTIVFNLPLPATITLQQSEGRLSIGADLTISGPQNGSLAINGNGLGIFALTARTVSLTHLTVQGAGGIAGDVGGISIGAGVNATLIDCRVDDNDGGGIRTAPGSTVTLINSTLSRNTVCGAAGGIDVGGTATLTNCTLTDNGTDGGYGGGVLVRAGGAATLTNCILRHNLGDVQGGGLFVEGGTATLTNTTLSRNYTLYGGGAGLLVAGGRATLTNCTLSGNAGHALGGGIEVDGGTAMLTNCTLTKNSLDPDGIPVDSIATYGSGTVTLTNTIVSGSPDGGGNCMSPVQSGGHNLDSDGSCVGGGTDLVDVNPGLAPLGYYGGSTETAALCTAPGIPDPICSGPSPAIDAGDDAVTQPPLALTTDQRGLPRPSGAHVDIGAYEVQPQDRVPVCVGDCNDDQGVSVDELETMVNIALGNTGTAACPAGDHNHDGQISVNEIVAAVSNALQGCSGS